MRANVFLALKRKLYGIGREVCGSSGNASSLKNTNMRAVAWSGLAAAVAGERPATQRLRRSLTREKHAPSANGASRFPRKLLSVWLTIYRCSPAPSRTCRARVRVATRHVIYERARKAQQALLRTLGRPLPESVIAREEKALDEAIALVEQAKFGDGLHGRAAVRCGGRGTNRGFDFAAVQPR